MRNKLLTATLCFIVGLAKAQTQRTSGISDSLYRLDSIVEYTQDAKDEWTNKSFKRSFSYTDTTSILKKAVWDKDSEQWKTIFTEKRTYDHEDKLKKHESFLLGLSGKKLTYQYNSLGKLTSKIESKFLEESNTWQETKKLNFIYNQDGLLKQQLEQHTFTDTPDWIAVGNTVYSYSQEGQLLADTTYIKQRNKSAWELFSKTDYSYANDKQETTIFYRWQPTAMSFTPYSKTFVEDEIDSKGSKTTTQYIWNKEHKEWYLQEQKLIAYTKEGFPHSFTDKIKNVETLTTTHQVYIHDYDISLSQLELPEGLEANEKEAFHHKINTRHQFSLNTSTNTMELKRVANYYYSINHISDDIKGCLSNWVKVTPNPASTIIQFYYPKQFKKGQLDVFHTSGKHVLSQPITNKEEININWLKKGLYIYRLQFDGKRALGKFLKK